jgi:hypothetical protein
MGAFWGDVTFLETYSDPTRFSGHHPWPTVAPSIARPMISDSLDSYLVTISNSKKLALEKLAFTSSYGRRCRELLPPVLVRRVLRLNVTPVKQALTNEKLGLAALHGKAQDAVLIASNVGHHALVLDEDDVVSLL